MLGGSTLVTVHVPSRSSRAEERLRRVSTDPAQDVSQDLARGGRIGIAPALEFAITAVIPAGLATRNYAGKKLAVPYSDKSSIAQHLASSVFAFKLLCEKKHIDLLPQLMRAHSNLSGSPSALRGVCKEL